MEKEARQQSRISLIMDEYVHTETEGERPKFSPQSSKVPFTKS